MGGITHMRPPSVHWPSVGDKTIEKMVKVLIKRLHPSVQAIDGSGGDGGIDLLMHTDDGLVIYQIKSFTGRVERSRRQKVERSLERAAAHDPVEWRLVVPIDPTPGELGWFEDLAAGYPFECSWDGETWLDSEMAQKPDIALYYLHGGEAQIVALLESIAPDHPVLEMGAVPASAERVAEIVARLNKLDPHHVCDITATHDGTVSVATFPRYPGASRDRPAATARLAFPPTADGAHAQQMVEEFFDYGTPCIVPAESVAEMSLHVPAGLGATFPRGDLALNPTVPEMPQVIEAALRAIDAQGTVLAQLSLETTETTAGRRGLRLILRDKSAAMNVEARFDVNDGSGIITVRYEHPYEFAPLDLLPAANFWGTASSIDRADHLALLVNGENVAQGIHDSGMVGAAAAEYVRFTEHLVRVQTTTGVFFNIRGEITPEDARDVVWASRLLGGERITQPWTELAISITSAGRGAIEAALSDAAEPAGTPVHAIRTSAQMSITVQGNIIPIGQVVQEIASARVLSWTEAGKEAPLGSTALTLVPAETDQLTLFLDNSLSE